MCAIETGERKRTSEKIRGSRGDEAVKVGGLRDQDKNREQKTKTYVCKL